MYALPVNETNTSSSLVEPRSGPMPVGTYARGEMAESIGSVVCI